MFHDWMLENKRRSWQPDDHVTNPVRDLNGGVGGGLI